MSKRVLSLFMVLVLCLTLLPTAAFAEGEDVSISGGVIGGGETGGEGGGVLVPPGGSTEGGGGTYIPGEDTRTEIWCVSKPDSIGRGYDGTTDGGTIPIDLTFTDGTNEIKLKEGTGFTAKKTFDSADAGWHTVTVEIALIGEAAVKYKLKAGEETFTIGGNINKAYPDLTVTLFKTACTAGEKLLPLLSVEGAPEDAEVTYYYLASALKSWAGSSDVEGSEAMPKIDENTAISEPGTYYVYAKSSETKNYVEERSETVELTVNKAVVKAASVTKADGTDGGTYESLPAALNAAQDGDTVKLLANHTTNWSDVEAGEYSTLAVIKKTLTLDLNGRTVDYLKVGEVVPDEEGGILESTDGNLTVTSSRSGGTAMVGRITTLKFVRGMLVIQGGWIGDYDGSKLTCNENSGAVTISGGTVCNATVGMGATVTVSGGSMHQGEWVNNGTLNITGGSFSGVTFNNNSGTIAISGGTFSTLQNFDNDSSWIAPMFLLAPGHAFYKDNTVQDGSVRYFLQDVTVKEHTHTMVDNKCACGYTCDHSNGFTDEGKCKDCGMLFAAVIGETYYTDVKSALDAATDGQTVKLLANEMLPDGIYVSKTLTLDLNGHSLSGYGLNVGGLTATSQVRTGNLTVIDSSGGNGAVGVTVRDGGTLVFEPKNDSTTLLQLEVWGGTVELYGGKISRSGLRLNNSITLSNLLPQKAGLAYYRGDTQLTLEEAASQTCDLVVKSCAHGDKNGFDENATACPYCNVPAVAETGLNGGEGGRLRRRFANLQTALDADRDGGSEFKLLTDVTGDYTIDGTQDTGLDLNGHSINGTVDINAVSEGKNYTTTLSNTKNTVTASINKVVAHSGAKLAGSGFPAVIGELTLADTTQWKDILQQPTRLGFKVTNADGTYQWYASDDVNGLQLNNVIINSLPITTKTLNLKVDGKNLTGNSPKVERGTTVQLFASCNAKDVTVTFSILKTGETTPITLTEPTYGSGKYTKDYSFDAIGEYTIYFTATKDGYSVTSSHKKLTVTKPNLSNAEITFPDGNEAAFNYVTATGVPMFIVTYNGKKLEKDEDFTIAGGDSFSGVGSCTLTIKATDNGDYTGSKSADWNVRPLKVAVSVGDIIKTYDGTTDLPANAKITFESADSYYTGLTLPLANSTDYEVLNACYDSADAGEEEKTISFTIKLKNEGYVFEDGTTQKDVTLNGSETDKTFKINKAALPTGYEPDNGGLIVKNGVAHTYTYDVSKLLKELPNGLNYGTTSYELESIGSVDNGYIEDGTVSIRENGMLTVPVKAVNTVAPSEIAIVNVKVTMQNYSDITIPVTVYARNRIVPTGEPTLDKNEITYGEKINKISMSGKLRDKTNNVDVAGTFTWNAPDTAPDAGDYEAEWTFTPNDVTYAPATGKVSIKVNKASLVEGVDYETPTAVTGLVYKVNDNTPQTLHTSGRVIGAVGTMKYTTDDPENAAAVWSDAPLTSRDAGEFAVYYKVFGDENHLDSDYGTITCRVAKYKLAYELVCLPKVYDGTKNGDPKNIKSIEFYGAEDANITVDLTEKDYTVESIVYESENVGGNLGTIPVSATAVIKLSDTKAASNYELAVDGNKAYGCITPTRIENVDFHGYTHKIRYIDTYAKTITVSYFGDVNRADYEIVSDMVSTGDSRIIRKISCDNTGITFAIADGLSADDVGKSYTIKVRIYTKDHNYCTDELPFTVEIADKDRPTLSVEPIEVTYNGKAVPESSINGTATVDGSRIDGTWSFKDGKAPTTVAESGDYTVVFSPTYPDYYYGAEKPVHVTVTPREIGDKDITFTYGESFVYTGKVIIPYIDGEYKYDENKALGLVENNDYTLTYSEDATNIGKKKITVTGHGNFGGTTELEYEITPSTQTPLIDLELPENGYVYDGTDKTPSVTVKVNGTVLTEGKDYELAYSNNRNAEDGAKVTVTAKGNYGFEPIVRYFSIAKADSVIDTEPASNSFTYDALSHGLLIEGKATGGSFEYKLGDGGWARDIPKAKDAGEYTVWYRVIGDSNHNDTGENSVKVTIERKDIADADIVLGPSLTYNTKEQVQTVFHAKFERFNATYNVENNRATNAGTYKLKVIGTGNFKGEREVEFTIAKKEVTASVTAGGEYIYNGKDIEPADITVRDGEDIIPDTEYTVSFGDNRNAGTAKVAITNAEGGNYIVNGTGEFEISRANITVKPKNISKVYGSAPEFKLESDSDLITEKELAAFASSAKFYSNGSEKTAKVIDGGYEITAELAENETDNLILTLSGTGILTVVPQKLTIKVNDVSRIYGEPNPELSVSYDGFIDGEDESVLGGTLVLKYNDDINETATVGLHENATTASGLTSKNYAIEFISGNVTIAKIPVNASAGTAIRSYLNVVFDKSLEGLLNENFIVKDSEGNTVTVNNVTASSDGKNYTLSGNFEVGKEYTVKVVLSGATVDATHQLATDEFVITPIRTSSRGGGTTRYTVSFETNGGSKISSERVNRNGTLTEPTAPTKEGFDFAGWYTDQELKTTYDFSAKVTKSITLYAAWTEKDNSINQIILTIGKKDAQVFGQIKTNDVAPKIVNDRTMLPARFVAENLGAKVEWDGEKELVTITGKNLKTDENVTILITIGAATAKVNGKEIKLDSPAFIENDRTYAPIRFISENLGASVEWVEKEQKVIITKPEIKKAETK